MIMSLRGNSHLTSPERVGLWIAAADGCLSHGFGLIHGVVRPSLTSTSPSFQLPTFPFYLPSLYLTLSSRFSSRLGGDCRLITVTSTQPTLLAVRQSQQFVLQSAASSTKRRAAKESSCLCARTDYRRRGEDNDSLRAFSSPY